MLSGYADSCSDVNLGVKSFIPLLVGQGVLLEAVEATLLFVDGGVRVLVLGLRKDGLFDQS